MVKNLELLTDEEILQLIHRIPVHVLLSPIQHENMRYKQYLPKLGRLQPSSSGVKKYIYSVAEKEFSKGNPKYVGMVEVSAQEGTKHLIEIIENQYEREVKEEDLVHFTIEEWINCISTHKKAGHDIDYTFLWAQMKLIGVSLTEDEKKTIHRQVEGSDLELSEEDSGNQNNQKIDEKASEEEQIEQNNQEADEDSSEEDITPIEQNKETKSREKKKKETKTPAEKALQSKEARRKAEEEKRKLLSEKEPESNLSTQMPEQAKRHLEEKGGKEIMPTYLGKVKVQNNFYNFTPVAILEGREFNQLTDNQVDRLLPASNKRNINLSFSPYDETQSKFMQDHFHNDQMILFSFTTESLLDNYDSMGYRNPTGYRVIAQDCVKNKSIRSLSEEGFFSLMDQKDLEEGSLTSKTIRIKNDFVFEGDRVLINMGKGFYAGPFTVKYSLINDWYYINTNIVENKFLISGYKAENCRRHIVEDWFTGSTQWTEEIYLYEVLHPENIEYWDGITDEQLLSALEEDFKSGGQDITGTALDINSIIHSQASVLVSDTLPESVRQERIKRLESLFETSSDHEDVLKTMMDMVYNLLVNQPEDERAINLVEKLLNRPGTLDQIQSYKVVRDRVENARHEYDELLANIEESKKKATEETSNKQLVEQKNEELQKVLEKLQIAGRDIDLEEKYKSRKEELKALDEEATYLESHKSHLINETGILESKLVDTINKYSDQMVGLAFDGFMSNKLLKAASDWEERARSKDVNDLIQQIQNINTPTITESELLNYVITAIQKERPQYNKNTIINIMICVTQGFLTVFAGAPGCGKTSICNIVSKTLGLTKINQLVRQEESHANLNRFIPVSVERGWTSKRDFIGYYNPLTKAFEETNREVFDGMRILDLESRRGITTYPFIILLDEANLSPMEYYWADFMNVCDDPEENHYVNLGNDYLFKIPETLHFVATINNDHTTETLSPRLIDRAWIISLPKTSNVQYGSSSSVDAMRLIQWASLVNTFGVPKTANVSLGVEVQRLYDEIRKRFAKMDIIVSPRADIAIRKYCFAASRIMEEDEFGNSASIVALDYAVLQKILPRISGNGDDYRKQLEEAETYLRSINLLRSSEAVSNILQQGDRQLKYYKFF